ncbi:hypothetical protein BCV72DRAFT_252796 [Rhizopus microsporus var. microsporus]|uniref:Uncharacterized protein n=1 Tax=Rhizopus microsporus var. microsporus TaxID=86635 RepID=A0A1X0QQ81_RHIZD|nr:hypothetical protein BCV72DRAFT_252796 [Rhizopus microsporus var. microsporus]
MRKSFVGELGCGEIKPLGAPIALIGEGHARLAETMKRQLNVRTMKAKSKILRLNYIFYSHMDVTLGLLLSFKNIIASLLDDTDITEPYIFNEYAPLLKPTVAFVNE